MSNHIDFGVQSYCFRHFKDNQTVASFVKELGLCKIEICGIHGDFHNVESWKNTCEIYRNSGVEIVSLGVETFHGLDRERAIFEAAALAGARHISAHFKVDTFATAIPRVRAWAREYGIRVGIHCHGGYMFGGSPDVLNYLISLGTPEIGLCLDSAWAMQIGPRNGRPVEWAAKDFAGKVYGVHFKDFVFERNGQWKDTIVGEGNLDLAAFVAALKEGGFDGMAVVEYEGEVENPLPSLKRCIESMHALIGTNS